MLCVVSLWPIMQINGKEVGSLDPKNNN